MKQGNYRPDIDGLRALAVIPVVLFHAGVSGFSGGFVGVDVFFVISGYLITGILCREIIAGNFSIGEFYARRIRRIFPALFVVLLFVIIVAPFSLLPTEYRTLPKETLGTLFFVANIVSWREAGYFTAGADREPLMHTWSLGIEEQFYIFAPLILLFVLTYMFRFRIGVVVAFAVVSFALSVYFTPSKPTAAFFLLPTRAWELLAGSLIALAWDRQIVSGLMREVVAASGLALLAISIFLFSEMTVFPGYAAALPVLASVMIICTAESTFVGRALAWKPLVGIGLISYSLYLWHWPLVVFFRDWGLLESGLGKALIVTLSLFLGWASCKFVETPFRQNTQFPTARLLKWSASGVAVIVGLAFATAATDGWPSRFSAQVQLFDSARDDISPSRGPCHFDSGLRASTDFCRLGGEQPIVALWGDSHGVEISQAIADAGVPILAITYSACAPGAPAFGIRPQCDAHNDYVLNFLSNTSDIETVILSARYRQGDSIVPAAVAQTAEALLQAGKRVVVIGPVPTPNYEVPSHLALGGTARFIYDGPSSREFMVTLPDDVEIVMPSEAFCDQEVCDMAPSGHALLFDDHHLSMSAAHILARDVLRKLH